LDAKVTWQGKMTFVGTANSGFEVQLGTDPGAGGDDDGLRPMELIAIGLAGCTAMDVISILRKKQQEVSGFEVHAHVERASEHPKVFTHVNVEYVVEGHSIDPQAVERAIELSVTKYCPAMAMLSKTAKIDQSYRIVEARS